MKFREAYIFFIIGAVLAGMAAIDERKWLYLVSAIMFAIGFAEWIISDMIEAWERAQKKKGRQRK